MNPPITHRTIEPAIHYWGTPVVLVSTLNADSTVNVAPMSSAWWLGWSCMLGMDAATQTVVNLRRERECVLNLASVDDYAAVDALARTTGLAEVPLHKRALGFRAERDKLGVAGLTTTASTAIRAPRVRECQVQLEARVASIRPFAQGDPKLPLPMCAIELRIVRVHVDERLLSAPDKIDAERWRPLIMSFRELYTLGPRVGPSRLARGREDAWAPWKRGTLAQVAARVLGVATHARYGVEDADASPEDEARAATTGEAERAREP